MDGRQHTTRADARAFSLTLGKYLKELRKDAGMSQNDIARYLGVSQQVIHGYERGSRRVSILILLKISEALDVSLSGMVELKKPRRRSNSTDPATVRLAWRLQRLSTSHRRYVVRLVSLCERMNEASRR